MTEVNNESPVKFVLLFENLNSIHLHKDVGQVPFQLHRHFGFDAEIACFKNEQNYAYINEEFKGLKLSFFRFSRYWYLLRNGCSVDVLMLFHISTKTIYQGLLYKALNPQGYLYVKADLASDRIVYPTWRTKKPLTVLKRKFLFHLFLKKVDIISFETKRSYDGAVDIPADKRMLVPNGFDPDLISHFGINRHSFEEKENAILLVARHGDHAKNSEFMFDVLLALGRLDSWKIYFIGSMTDEFRQRKDAFLADHSQFRDCLVFTGQVDDKQQLFEYYNRSKILCVTSRSESWGMVCVEALCFGNALLMTNVNSSTDLTSEGMVGAVISQGDYIAYSRALRTMMTDSSALRRYHDNALQHFSEHFVWKDILLDLASRIKERQKHEKQ